MQSKGLPGSVRRGMRQLITWNNVAARLRFHLSLSILALALGIGAATPANARMFLQCVTFARADSGIDIHGDAAGWWQQADGLFDRGSQPDVGAVLAFKATSSMPRGHVAVVSQIIDQRHVMLDHANWSGRGQVERHVLAEDVSANGDWTKIKVWYAPTSSLGLRENPTFGFIYASHTPSTAVAATAVAAGLDHGATLSPEPLGAFAAN